MKIYNTATGRKETFEPLVAGRVSMYACGPTVYNYFHIGNARTFLFFDVVRRWFQYIGFDVRYVQNITDIDDKIIAQATLDVVPAAQVAEKYATAFIEDTNALGIEQPDYQPRATQYIPQMIALIDELVKKGHAYELDGDVYFAVESLPGYGSLARKNLDDLKVGARVAANTRKRHPSDFVLWKAAKPGEPKWDSPWGEGRPGWHTECVVMSQDLLGDTFDIHAGAIDLIFPHHENELAQARARTGKPLANVWMHGGFLNMRGDKMSKSEGNFFTARDVLQKYDAETVRLFFLSKHYRSPIEYSPELLDEARTAMANFYDALQFVGWKPGNDAQASWSDEAKARRDEFIAAMDNDFNTARAVSVLFELARAIKNEKDYAIELRREFARLLVDLGGALGFFTDAASRLEVGGALTGKLLDLLVGYRIEFRSRKMYDMADRVRDDLAALGVELKDTRDGTVWSVRHDEVE
ncbi:MAG: cysteine--tRNA ligase [Candidatus Cloacimonetes bacterium]|nr:cysteine--tRNA ligase [Candidatus Cloacimonadota bacterium]